MDRRIVAPYYDFMSTLRLGALVTVAFLALSNPAVSQQASPATPASVVSRYCQSDFNGARTSSQTYREVTHLVRWTSEPGWDTVSVVKKFGIVSKRTISRHATVVVDYEVLGEIAGWDFTSEQRTERVQYSLDLGDKAGTPNGDNPVLAHSTERWRISDPVIQPHISLAFAIHHIKWLIRTQDDPEHKLPKVLAQLQALQKNR